MKPSGKSVALKKKVYSHSAKDMAKPKVMDSKKVSAKGAPDEIGHKKAAQGKGHKQISGDNEMKAMLGGAKHKGMSGPGDFMNKKDGMSKGMPKHEADMFKGQAGDKSHLGKHGSASSLKKGHTSLGKVGALDDVPSTRDMGSKDSDER